MKKENVGITLIALIITIIVSLILAGVSISMVVGDNGVPGQAVNASTATDVAETKEAIELAVIGYLDEDGKYTEDNVLSAVQDVLGSDASIDEETGGVYTVTTSKGNTVDITELMNGARVSGITAAKVTADMYGAVVQNYTVSDSAIQSTLDDKGITWKIFYSDGSNIYLIASDYVPASCAPASSSGATPTDSSYPYGLILNNVYSDYSGATDITDSRLIALNSLYFESYSDSTNANMKCVAYLMDTSIWKTFAGSYADYAIGGTTIEMWVASWNEKGYTQIYCDSVNSYGYKIGTSSDSMDYSVYTSSLENSGYNDELYFSHTSGYDGCFSYYLASTSSAGSYVIMNVSYNGFVTGMDSDEHFYALSNDLQAMGFRPLVCLTSTTELEEVYDGVYSIIK